MRELRDLVKAWRGLERGEEAVLATVVATTGSTYRRAGARMLLTRSRRLAGSISGGCLESDLTERAWRETEHGVALVTYDSTSSEDLVWGFGLGCAGTVTVMLQRLPGAAGALEFLAERIETATPGVLATDVETGEIFTLTAEAGTARGAIASECEKLLGQSRAALVEEPRRVLIEGVLPPLRLGVFGAGFDASPLLEFAKSLGWETKLFDHRPAVATAENFPAADQIVVGTYSELGRELGLDAAVVMTHHYLNDREILARILPQKIGYVGLLGPKARTRRLLSELDGIDSDRLAQVRGPVGLDIGAEGPHEIALSIAAEIQAAFSRRQGGELSKRPGSVHAA